MLCSAAVTVAVDVDSSAPIVAGGSVSTTQQQTLPSVPDSVQLQLDVATTSVIPVSSSRAADCENANTGPAMSDANPVDCTSVTQTNMRVGMFYGSRCRRAIVKPSKYC